MPGFLFCADRALVSLSRLLIRHRLGRRKWSGGMGAAVLLLLLPTRGAPAFAMLADPVEQCAFETDIVTEAFRLQPFVFQDLFPFGEELLVEAGLLNKLAGRGRLW